MESAAFKVREEDPFLKNSSIDFSSSNKAAYRGRLRVLW